MSGSQQTSSKLEDNNANGKTRKTRHWWKMVINGKFIPPVTHDQVTLTDVAKRQGREFKHQLLGTDYVVIGDKTIPVDGRYLDLSEENS